MTEFEKIERAKMYMEKLANGVDPITNTEIPKGDVANNVRLSRCFSFVSDVLGKVIEQGGIEEKPYTYKAKNIKKEPFSLTAEQASRFEFSSSPMSASDIAKRLEVLIDTDTVKKLTASNILAWLESIGALTKEETESGNKRTVTDTGADMGIVSEAKISSYGNPYTAILFNRSAQQFILDNTDAIAAYIAEQKEDRKANKGTLWTQGDEMLLLDMYNNGATVRQMAQTLKRSCYGVRKRLQKMGLSLRSADEQKGI